MMTSACSPLETYLAMEYGFQVMADPDGGFVAVFPDLPGCMTQAESLAELATMAEDARRLWITTAFEHRMEIPLPSYPEQPSGKFTVCAEGELLRGCPGSSLGHVSQGAWPSLET